MLDKKNPVNKIPVVLPSLQFDQKGSHRWPGSRNDCLELLDSLPYYKNIEEFKGLTELDPLILEKMKDWSFLEICCSFYYFYVETVIEQRQREGDRPVNVKIWSVATALILNPTISDAFLQFFNDLNLAKISNFSTILDGLMIELSIRPFIYDEGSGDREYKNLLTIIWIDSQTKNRVIKEALIQHRSYPIIKILLELKQKIYL